jgi:hypothetical protein
MATARDGKMFSGRQAMLSHERKLPPMGGGGGGMKKDPLKMPGQGGGADEGMGEESPEETVAAHGPANVVHITHDHAAGKHHVHSEHEDGHATESDHGSADEASDRGKALASEGAPAEDDGAMEGAEFE